MTVRSVACAGQLVALMLLTTLLAGCSLAPFGVSSTPPSGKLRLATTTSTYDSGLLETILPDFERRYDARVDVIAVGTGQALKLGENGDVDVVLVHAPSLEQAFVAHGFGTNRQPVMYNDFVIVGPQTDPADIRHADGGADAFRRVAAAEVPFVSRGDESGTHTKEQAIWDRAGVTLPPNATWYRSLGQGMGETLIVANEQRAYTLADRGTFLAMQGKLGELAILVGGADIAENPDPFLRNPYSVIQVNPVRHPNVRGELAAAFVSWMTSPHVQGQIAGFGQDRFGTSLFYPQAKMGVEP